MFVQIHMLQSLPPGNLNRDDTGQPKKCLFGGVTRGRISSQCLKRNIRHSLQFKEAYGNNLAVRTTYLPRMVANELKTIMTGISEEELNKVTNALAKKFKAETTGADEAAGDTSDSEDTETTQSGSGKVTEQTGQLVFFPPAFANSISHSIADLYRNNKEAFVTWINGKKPSKEIKPALQGFEDSITLLSKSLTVDIGLFGRMTTSDIVVNVEAACQVAHAISTHETLIESDYFTALDEKKAEFAKTQSEKTGAAFLGSGESETFFDAAVYYKYLNLDVDALKGHLEWNNKEASLAAGTLVKAAALTNPSGKQNSFASHGVPELILVEVSITKLPISYTNAFLKPVDGPDLMLESKTALGTYINNVASAYSPADMNRVLLEAGSSVVNISKAQRAGTLDELVAYVETLVEQVS